VPSVLGREWGEFMKLFLRFHWIVAMLVIFVCAGSAFAQRPGANAAAAKPAAGAYDVSKDVSVQGTVVKYTENSQTPPIGAHVLLQTSSGNVDVHLGDARLLHLAKLTLAQGTNARVVGQMGTAGQNPIFFARLVQVGTQLVAVRSNHGLPLSPAGVRANKALRASAQADQKGGAR
jgi:hypothetical protein